MSIPLICPTCGARFRIPDDSVGRRARCRDCRAAIEVSTTAEPPTTTRARAKALMKKREPENRRPMLFGGIGLCVATLIGGVAFVAGYRGGDAAPNTADANAGADARPVAGERPPAAGSPAAAKAPGARRAAPVTTSLDDDDSTGDAATEARAAGARPDIAESAASAAPSERSPGREGMLVEVQSPGGTTRFERIPDASAPGGFRTRVVYSARPSIFRPDAPQRAAPELLEKVAKLYAKSPRSPIAPPAEVRRGMDIGGRRLSQQDVAEESYKRHGRRDPKWDDAALQMIRMGYGPADFDSLDSRLERIAELNTLQQQTIGAGCDDLQVWRTYLGNLSRLQRLDLAMPLLHRAVESPPETTYPRHVRLQFRTTLLSIANRGVGEFDDETKARLLAGVRAEALAALREGPDELSHPRLLLIRFWSARNACSPDDRGPFIETIVSAPGIDPWVSEMLLAKEHYDRGWAARGAGLADTVTEEGWRAFGIHMRQSAVHLLKAWELHPEFPEAACEMIRNTMAIGGVAGENERFWFDQAIAADPGYLPAYSDYRWTLRPRWGGSHSEMIAFGVECLATGRYDLGIPKQFHRAALDVVSELRDDAIYREFSARGPQLVMSRLPDRKYLFGMPGIYENYRKLCSGQLEWLKTQDRPDLVLSIKTRQVVVAYLAGRFDDARGLLAELGDELDHEEVVAWSVEPEWVMKAIRAVAVDDAPRTDAEGAHAGAVRAIAVTPDERQIISGGEDGSVRFRDSDTGEVSSRVEFGAPVFCLAVSPDGEQLAIGGFRPEIRIWDIASRTQVRVLKTPAQNVWTLAFSPDGKTLVSGGGIDPGAESPGEMLLWNVADGSIRATLAGHRLPIRKVQFAPDGKTVASAAGNGFGELGRPGSGELFLWDAASGKRAPTTLELASCVDAFAFSPDGKSIVAVEEVATERDGKTDWPERLLRFDLPSGERTVLKENINNVQHLAFAPDGKSVATADALATIRFWDPEGAGRNEFAILLGHAGGVDSIAFAPSGAFLASGGRDGRVLIWKLEPDRLPESRLLATMTEHLTVGPITGLRYSPNGTRIYAVDRYAAVLEWNALEDFRGERVLGFQRIEFGSPSISAFDVSPDGRWLAVAHDPGRALGVTRLYDLGTGELKHTLRHQRLAINALRFTPDSRSLVTGGYGGGAVLWDLTKDKPEIWAEQEDPLWSMDVSPDGRWLACGDEARLRFVRVPGFDARIGRGVVALFDDFVDTSRPLDVTGLAFSPKGDRLAVTSSINGGLWDVEGRSFATSFSGKFLCFHPDGTRFFTSTPGIDKGTIQIWETASGKEQQSLSGAHFHTVNAAACSPDGKLLITGGADRRLRVWDLSTGKLATAEVRAGRPRAADSLSGRNE